MQRSIAPLRALPLAALASLATLLVATPAAHAQDINGGATSVFSFTNGAGFVTDGVLTGTGQIDAYDGAFRSRVNGVNLDSAATISGQFVTGNFTATAATGLNLRNRYFVSPTLPAVRLYVDLQNTTGAPISFTYSLFHNLGSDGAEATVFTSSGDNLLTTADRWVITDDSAAGTNVGDPALTFILYGLGASVTPSAVPEVPGSGFIRHEFNITVGANQTIGLFFIGGLSTTANNALAVVNSMDDWSEIAATDLTSGLSTGDIAAIRNFNTNVGAAVGPEPGSLALLGVAALPLVAWARRRRTA